MPLTIKQRGVLRGMSIAAAFTILGIVGGILLSPRLLTPRDDLGDRLAFVLGWDLLVVFWLSATVGTLARRRFFSPEDIDGGANAPGTAGARIHQAIVQNTLEQVVLAVSVHSACAVLFPIDWMPAIPVAAVLFAVGRFLFWRGYHRGAPARAIGFGLTFYPTLLLFALLVTRYFY
jgi:hypothetical protein